MRVMERQGNAPPDNLPFALAREGHHGPVIHDINYPARKNGILSGKRVVDMRAICPELQVEYANITGDRTALDRLVLWARRWCPWSVRDNEDGLILDTTGADHLWGGEAAMLAQMEADLSSFGLSARLAVAPTWGAAWALARYGPVRACCGAEEIASQLSGLPVAALRLKKETALLLHRLGLKTIGSLDAVPRLSLARRFAKAEPPANPLLRLDQALGRQAEPVSSVKAEPPVRAIVRLSEPISDPTPYLPGLCEKICAQLTNMGAGCRGLLLMIYRTDGDVVDLSVTISALSRTPDHLQSLFRDRLEQINPGFGFDLITLDARGVEPMQERQRSLDGGNDNDLQLNRLVDRLTARFGSRSVTCLILRQSHMPERAEAQIPAMAGVPAEHFTQHKERPLRLLDCPEEVRVLYAIPEGPPAQFTWRRQTHRVARYAGPERISPEWWKDRSGTRLRDYFKIEDHMGRRLWLYREGLHGDRRGGDPRWFVHGSFR